jgi:hypothetical protein
LSPIRLAGSILGLVNGAWAAYIAFVALNATYNCGPGGCPESMFAFVPYARGQVVAGGLLVIVSLISFTGRRPTFVLGGVLSAAVLVTLALTWGTPFATNDSIAAAVLSTTALGVDVVASRPSKELSERDSPLNLPVFG